MDTQVTRWPKLLAALVVLATVAACAEQTGDLYSAVVPESTTVGDDALAETHPPTRSPASAGAGEKGAAAIGPTPQPIKPPIILPTQVHVEMGTSLTAMSRRRDLRHRHRHGAILPARVSEREPTATADAVASFAANTITDRLDQCTARKVATRSRWTRTFPWASARVRSSGFEVTHRTRRDTRSTIVPIASAGLR